MYEEYLPDGILSTIKTLYSRASADVLLFHNWNHIDFITNVATQLALHEGCKVQRVALAALTHDLNYMVDLSSGPEAGAELRRQLLGDVRVPRAEIRAIEDVIISSHTAYRGSALSVEAQCLSDADTLFKSLPITPIVNARKYCIETGTSLRGLCEKILIEQLPLFESGIYFYTQAAKERYGRWAETNLELWKNVREWFDSDLFRKELAAFDS